jgi:hypothetical protein
VRAADEERDGQADDQARRARRSAQALQQAVGEVGEEDQTGSGQVRSNFRLRIHGPSADENGAASRTVGLIDDIAAFLGSVPVRILSVSRSRVTFFAEILPGS